MGTVNKKVTYEALKDSKGNQTGWSPVFQGFSDSDIRGYWNNIPESMHGLPVARGQEWEELNVGRKQKSAPDEGATPLRQPEFLAQLQTKETQPVPISGTNVQAPRKVRGIPEPQTPIAQKVISKKKPVPIRATSPALQTTSPTDSQGDTKATSSGGASPIGSVLDYLRGKPVSFDRGSFSPEQKAILYKTALAARKRTGKFKGGTEYEDYRGAVSPEDYQRIAALKQGKAGFASALGSMTNPAFGVASTIGRFSYETDPKTGETVVRDNYDFSNRFSKKGKVTMEGKSLGERIYGGVRNLLSSQDEEKGVPDNRIQFRLYPSDTVMSKKKTNRFANLYAAGGEVCHECEQEAAMRLAQYLSGGNVKKYAGGSPGVAKWKTGDPLYWQGAQLNWDPETSQYTNSTGAIWDVPTQKWKLSPDVQNVGGVPTIGSTSPFLPKSMQADMSYEDVNAQGAREALGIEAIDYAKNPYGWTQRKQAEAAQQANKDYAMGLQQLDMSNMTATPQERADFAAAEPLAAARFADWKKTVNAPAADVTTDAGTGYRSPAGDLVGTIGSAVGAIGPLLTTLKNRQGDKPNINPFLRFGQEGLDANLASQNLVSKASAAARQQARIAANTAKASNRLGASSINTLRALDIATDFNNDVVNTGIESSEAQNMINLLSARTNLLNQRDQVVMGGEYTRDQADRRDRDAYFTALSKNLADAGTMIQTQGRNMNQQTLNRQEMGLMNELSKYGLGFKQVGNDYVLTKVK